MRPFDSHTHIQSREYDSDREEVIVRAKDAGLIGMLVLGEDVASSVQAIDLAEAHDVVFAAAGCHPHNAASMDDAALAELATLAQHPRVAAVGEIGLDFYRDLSPREAQVRVLESQLQIAAEIGKPVAVHCRDAHEAFLPIAEAWSGRLSGRLPDGRPLGVMHYFSADAALARRYVELGFLISIHTSVTYARNERLHGVARAFSIDCLVVETDSPYGAPQSIRGKRNEPAYVIEAVKRIAELQGEAVDRVAEVTAENACRLFGVHVAPQAAARMSA